MWTLKIEETKVENCDWTQIQQAIEQMNNETITNVCLVMGESDDDDVNPWMEAIGGNKGRYHVLFTAPSSDILDWMLFDLSQTEGTKVFHKGLKEIWDLKPHYAVSKELALTAFHYFYEHQSRKPDLVWLGIGETDPYL